METIIELLPIGFDWRDGLDILLITFLLYKSIQMLKGTQGLAVLLGLGLIMCLYMLSINLGLYSTTWLLQNIVGSLLLVVIVLFQKDIRQGLGEMGARYFWRRSALRRDAVDELVGACVSMSQAHIGALIVLERSVPLGDTVRRDGIRIDARLSRELLTSIFYPNSTLHDGAVIISKGRIMAASCILPLALVQNHEFGTRHRAGLGITMESDAIAIIVSEERGEMVVAQNGALTPPLCGDKLKQVIADAL